MALCQIVPSRARRAGSTESDRASHAVAVDAIPEQARRSPLPHGILVHGELTGHSHRLEDPKSAALFSAAPGIGAMFLEVPAGGTRIVHEEHGPIELPQGLYRVWRQREYSPQAIRFVQD
jgi:hypothetical protein